MKKIIFFYLFILLLSVNCSNIKENTSQANEKPVPVIFDTDMAGDVDDVGALAALHAMADYGEVEILGVMSCVIYPYTLLCADRINTYFNRKNLSNGQLKNLGVDRKNSLYAQHIAEEFQGTLQSADDVPDAVDQYRKILSMQPDNSVVILTVGFLTNIRNLIHSKADNYSDMDGSELVRKKVRLWVCMGGKFPSGSETNIRRDAEASIDAIDNWPTDIVFSGWEIGTMNTGGQISNLPESSPVRRAYELFGRIPHKSWDQVATLYAVRGIDNGTAADYWKLSAPGQIIIDKDDGSNIWKEDPKGTHRYLIQVGSDEDIATEIDALMMHLPK